MATSTSQPTSRDPWSEFTEIEPATKSSGKFWENDELIERPTQARPEPVFTVPDPQGEYERARDNRAEGRDIAAEGRAERGERREIDEQAFDRASKLRTEFLSNPEVRQFREVRNISEQINALANREGSAMGDLGLVFSFMKSLDPGSTVMAGEQATAQNAAGVPGQIRNAYNSLVSGERLNQKQRADMASIAQSNLIARSAGYNELVRTYSGLLEAEGVDPASNGISLFEVPTQPAPPRAATTEDAIRAGADIRFGMDGTDSDSVFDRAAYLEETYGISGSKEARLTASLNQLSGQQVTPTQIAALYGQLDIPLPPEEELGTMAESLRQGQRYAGFDTSDAQAAYEATLDQVLDQRGADPESFSGAVGINAAQGLTFNLGDEIAGVAGGVRALATGNDVGAAYQAERDVVRRNQERARAARPITSAVSELGGALPTGALIPGSYLRNARAAAKVAAAEGALYGYGSGEGLADSTVRAGVGAAAGGALGYGISRAGEKLAARRANSSRSQGGEMIEAADRLNDLTGSNIRPLPADVAGPGIRNASGGMGKMPISAGMIVRQANRTSEEAEKAKDAIASIAGTSQEVEAAGETALKGAQSYIKRSRAKVNTLYERARKLGGDRPVDLINARAVLDEHIAELAQTPGGAKGLERMRKLRAELDQPYPVEGVKRMRTSLNDEFLNDGLTGSDLERRMKMVTDAADDDITDSLVAAGSEGAARAYRQAADAHKERLEVIETVLVPFIGRKGADPKSGEEVVMALEAATKRRSAKLGKFMAALPKEDAATVRATIIDRLGKPTAGTETAESTFSLDRFLTQWQGMTDRAKGAMFGGELRKALDDLATVASGRKEARKFVNFPNTGSTIGALASGGALVGAATNPWWLGLSALDVIGGLLLSSPKVARLLAKAPSPQSAMNGLEKIARAEPAIATEVLGLHKAISDALNVGATRMAAEPAKNPDGGSATKGLGTQ
ncbi:hypothetical protein P8Q88_10180 [Qipengyuania sp. XHP0207]|uniref:hypothetical protein n=1 Tax=Qipengyuania sp. XHP0207 TaxID=3038078 RepID=UPI00241D1C3C|nr:hypothetical protein [Qipengyuania sp. XHP0207]MDG5748545.1 hypothetical protein [Qipengyuania sp. XHP0207]